VAYGLGRVQRTCISWGADPEGVILREKRDRDSLLWAVQKRLNRSRCRLGCGLGSQSNGPREARVSRGCTLVNLANMIEPFTCGGDAVFCQITLVTC